MSSRIPPRHAFSNAYFWTAEQRLVLEFIDGTIYEVTNVNDTDWGEFQDDVHRGRDWNLKTIALCKGHSPTHKIHSVPTGYDDSVF